MRFLMFTGLAVLLILVGCADSERPTAAPALDTSAQAEAVNNEGLFRGTIDGIGTTIGYCGPYTLKVDFDGSGTLSFLGLTRFDGIFCSVWTHTEPPFEGTMTGEGVAVGANGDQVFLTMEGTYLAEEAPPTILKMWGTYTVTGGTGRFLTASGSGSLYGEQELLDFGGIHRNWFRFDGSLQF